MPPSTMPKSSDLYCTSQSPGFPTRGLLLHDTFTVNGSPILRAYTSMLFFAYNPLSLSTTSYALLKLSNRYWPLLAFRASHYCVVSLIWLRTLFGFDSSILLCKINLQRNRFLSSNNCFSSLLRSLPLQSISPKSCFTLVVI